MLDAIRTSDSRVRGGAELVWWGVVASLSLAAIALPNYVSADPDPTLRLLISGAALLFTGTLAGYLRPGNVWRWALASLIAFVLRDVLIALNAETPPDANGVLYLLADNAQLYLIETLAVFLGASFGSWSTKAGLD